MVYWLWCALAILISALAEMTLGQVGVPVPVLIPVAFYFAVLGPWYKCSLPLMLGAALVDGILPYAMPACGMTMLALLLIAVFWRSFGSHCIVLTAIPGCLLGVLYGSLRVLAAGLPGRSVLVILIMTFAGGVLTPLLAVLLENVGRLLALRRLAKIHLNYADEYYIEGQGPGDE